MLEMSLSYTGIQSEQTVYKSGSVEVIIIITITLNTVGGHLAAASGDPEKPLFCGNVYRF